MLYTYRFRLEVTEEERLFLSKQIGCCRFVYNYLLNKSIEEYKESKKPFNYYELKKELPLLKKEYEFLKEGNSQSLQEAVKNLKSAFCNFFEGRAKFPVFKKKKDSNSISIPQHFSIKCDRLSIPKLKSEIKIKLHREIEGSIKNISITKTGTYNYYVNILVEKEIEVKKQGGCMVGLDVGLTHFVTISTGEKIGHPKILNKSEKKLKKEKRRLSRKCKGSKNREKARYKVALVYEKIKNQRKDFLHKLSRRIVDENQVIIVEDINVKGLLKNRHLSKSISDSGWGIFTVMLEYKSKLYGSIFHKVDTFYPSSKVCNNCKYKNKNLKLSDRIWVCPCCGSVLDRDLNASLNIRDEGFANLKALGYEFPEVMPVEDALPAESVYTESRRHHSEKQDAHQLIGG
ncbi:MAG: putative transposase [bacterium ADurb.Bin363]|nr:MAG: putative transposase [bacterium ADurb.Bin363]